MFDEFITNHKQAAMQVFKKALTFYQLHVKGEVVDTNFPNQLFEVLNSQVSAIHDKDYKFIENDLGKFRT